MIDPTDLHNRGEFLTTPRRRGRPRLPYLTVPTSVRLPAEVYDALCHRATEERRSLHSTMQAALTSYVRQSSGE